MMLGKNKVIVIEVGFCGGCKLAFESDESECPQCGSDECITIEDYVSTANMAAAVEQLRNRIVECSEFDHDLNDNTINLEELNKIISDVFGGVKEKGNGGTDDGL